MDQSNYGTASELGQRFDEPGRRYRKQWAGLSIAAKSFRAATAIVVFGIPLVAGTAALIAYGIRSAAKSLRRS